MKMEVANYSETSITNYKQTRRHIQEALYLQTPQVITHEHSKTGTVLQHNSFNVNSTYIINR